MRRLVGGVKVLLVATALSACQQPSSRKGGVTASARPIATAPVAVDVVPEVAVAVTASPGASCLSGGEQRGPGCDMDGVMAAVKPLRQPGAAIPNCYLAEVRPPRPGKLRVRFSLESDGRGTGWQWTRDDFALPSLQACLQEALASVTYPAPGDKSCQVVYPFTFIPEVRSGK